MPSGFSTVDLGAPFVTTQANRTDAMSEIIDIQTPAGKQFDYPATQGIEMFLMTHESFTTSATAGTATTHALSNDLVDSPRLSGSKDPATGDDTAPPGSGAADLVAYEDGSQVTPDTVHYDTNEVTYTNSTASSTLDVYYVWGDSSLIEGRWYQANEESYDQVFGATGGQMHTTKTFSDEGRVTFMNSFEAGPKDRLKFLINSSVDLTNWNSNTSDQADPTSGASSFSHIRIPVTSRNAPNRASRRSRR